MRVNWGLFGLRKWVCLLRSALCLVGLAFGPYDDIKESFQEKIFLAGLVGVSYVLALCLWWWLCDTEGSDKTLS